MLETVIQCTVQWSIKECLHIIWCYKVLTIPVYHMQPFGMHAMGDSSCRGEILVQPPPLITALDSITTGTEAKISGDHTDRESVSANQLER